MDYSAISFHSRFRGCLLGLIVGDALGSSLENQEHVATPISDMVGGGPFHLLPGQFTDDSTTALLLCESFLSVLGFSPADQLERYLSWYREGHLSSTGVCFDIGIQTRTAVLRYEKTKEEYPTSSTETRAGNGSLIRLAPVVLAYSQDNTLAINMAKQSSRTTHGAIACVDACAVFAAMLLKTLSGASKQEILDPSSYEHVLNDCCEEIQSVIRGSYLDSSQIAPSGYVVKTLEAALWAFHKTSSFSEGLLLLVNLGGDSDSTGAVYGQIAGCYYGEDNIPRDWREKISFKELISETLEEMHRLSLVNAFAAEGQERNTSISLSEAYVNTNKCFSIIEELTQQLKRRLEPCPQQYQSIEELERDIEKIKLTYKQNSPSCVHQDTLWLEYYNGIILPKKEILKRRLTQPRVILPSLKR